MKIAFISVPVPGHLNPMCALARKLQSRNHETVLMCLPDTEPFVRAAGLSFLPCCENEFPIGSVDQYVRGIGTRQGEEALQLSIEACAAMTNAMFNSLPATLKAVAVDALVLDTYLFFAELLPISLGMPYAHVSNALQLRLLRLHATACLRLAARNSTGKHRKKSRRCGKFSQDC
jgi:hypothetical protein